MSHYGTRLSSALAAATGSEDQSIDRRLRKTLSLATAAIGALMTTMSATLAAWTGNGGAATVLYGYAALLAIGTAAFYRFDQRQTAIAAVLLGGNLAVAFGVTYFGGGIVATGANVAWGIVPPIIALLVFTRRQALQWFAAYAVILWLSIFVPARPVELRSPGMFKVLFANNLFGISVFVLGTLVYFMSQRDEAYRQIEIERERSDRLLTNMLPEEIAERLKQGEAVIADEIAGATVLFADIAGFTPMSASMGASEVVELLNDVFSEFDHLADRHGVEKIKTIGDCYMAAAGVPVARQDHAETMARLALEMQALVASRDFGGHRLALRIGLHSGSLVAGVIGERKFIYDLWGDSVNTASRMESQGLPGEIQVSDETRRLLGDAFRVRLRGPVDVKGKGLMLTHILDGCA